DNGNAYVRLVAGQLLGATGPAHTYTSIIAAHISLKNKSHIEIPVPRDHNTFVHVLDGEIKVGTNKQVSGGSLVLFKADGDFIEIKTGENSQISNILLLSGKPINEPVVTYGPFVMNSEEEIKQAYADYQQGKMGKIDF
ncbi:MAG: pirin family protein, partial [Bacteroidia bacterium]|nr:pirin family protein [Bacteroidia bacterium]